MPVRLIFLGKLGDLAGTSERELDAPLDWEGLLSSLGESVRFQVRDERIRLALNGQLLADRTTLAANDGDEVALLPPVSGG